MQLVLSTAEVLLELFISCSIFSFLVLIIAKPPNGVYIGALNECLKDVLFFHVKTSFSIFM